MSTGPTTPVPAEDLAPAACAPATLRGAPAGTARRAPRRRRAAAVLAGGLALTLVAGSAAAALPREPLAAAAYAGPGAGRAPAWPSSGTTTTTQTDATPATSEEATGVVVIETVLGYQDAEAAGTGIVLTSDGLVLTNDHVVAGSTEIRVAVPATGATYTATVVGTDASSDVAVLELDDASGLATATLDDDGEPAVGDAVTAVGNAGGTGELVAADGTVTALGRTITTAAEGAASSETLEGLIEVDADIVSGDSGGPLLDAEGEVVGIDTAASSGTSDIVGYAIDVDDAMAIVQQVLSGEETATVTLGYPAFLGVEVASPQAASAGLPGGAGYGASYGAGLGASAAASSSTAGALVAGVVEGAPAATAGLAAGDTITAVDGAAVTTADDLTATLAEHDPGDTVTVIWTDAAGQAHEADVTLAQGPVA